MENIKILQYFTKELQNVLMSVLTLKLEWQVPYFHPYILKLSVQQEDEFFSSHFFGSH